MRSITEANDSASVSLLNLPSQDTAVPAESAEVNSRRWRRRPLRTCGKRSEQIVHPQGTRDSDSEQRQGKILSYERFTVRQASVVRKSQDFTEPVSYRTLRTRKPPARSRSQSLTNHGAEHGAKDDLVCERGGVSSKWNVKRLEHLQSHPTRNHFAKASLLEASIVR